MSKTYRSSDPTRWGPGKGSNLSAEEFDTNTWELDQGIKAILATPPQANGIANIQVSGAAMTITLMDGTTLGPYQMPVLAWNFRGNWLPLTPYNVLDTFVRPGVGLFITREQSVSPASWDPNFVDPTSGLPAYQQILGFGQLGIAGSDGDRLRYDATQAAWVNVREKYIIGFNFNGVMGDNQDILHHEFPVGVTYNPNFADYLEFSCRANSVQGAASDTTINIDQALAATPNTWTNVGTLLMPASGGPGVLSTTSGTLKTFAKGDVMRIIGPGTHDPLLAGLYGTLVGFET